MKTPHRALALAVAFLSLGWPTSARAQDRVGVAGAVNQIANFDRGGTPRTVVIGADVAFEERIVTADEGLVQVLFEDGSTFTVGPNAQVVIDAFVYDPATGAGEIAATVTRGALRFVGGRASKNRDAVRFRTRSGTLVVRGAILNLDLDPPCLEDGRCPDATASLVFGRELLLTLPSGGTRRIYDDGYAFAIFGSGAGARADVVPNALLDQSGLQQQLSGTPGQTGGAPVSPTEEDVVASGVGTINSALAPFVVLPRPKPVTVQSQYTPTLNVLGLADINGLVEQTIIEPARRDLIRVGEEPDAPDPDVPDPDVPDPTPDPVEPVTPDPDDPGPDPDVDGPQMPAPDPDPTPDVTDPRVPEPARARVLRTPTSLPAPNGAVVSAAGAVNIVGTNGASDRVASGTLLRDSAGTPVALVIDGDELAIPVTMGTSDIASFDSNLLGGTAVGTAFRGPDDFWFFYLRPDRVGGATEEAVYVFDGTPTRAAGLFGSDQVVRTYALTDDFQRQARGIPSDLLLLNPLVALAFGSALSNSSETPYAIALRTAAAGPVAQGLYAGLLIDGSGPAQRSAVTLDVSAVTGTASGIDLVGLRRGSYRLAAGAASVGLSGGTLARSGPDGTSGFFGPNGNAFVYSSGPDLNGSAAARSADLFEDRQLAAGGVLAPNEVFSAATAVASLVDQQGVGALTRTERTLLGYAAGVLEPSGGAAPVPVHAFALGGFQAAFDPTTSTLGGRIVVVEINDNDPTLAALQVSFGFDLPVLDGGSTTRSAFVDDDLFAAVGAGPEGGTGSPTTVLITDGAGAFAHDPNTDPGTYVLSSDAVAAPQLFAAAGVEPCECAFLEWGYWGTQTTFSGDGLPGGTRQDSAHLGTWAAADITRNADLPLTGTGRYAGHAVGNVVNDGAQYLAAGRMDLTYDFGARRGDLAISNFDGRDVSGAVNGIVDANGNAQFFGNLAGAGLNGNAAGAFANGPAGPAQGVLGRFDVSGGGYQAVGTFVGQR